MEKLKITQKPISYDNEALLKRYYFIKDRCKAKETQYKSAIKTNYEQNYIKVYMAKLAYFFAKEEKGMLYNELLDRGLITYTEQA